MHFRTKSSQPVLPAALRELVSMEMILPGRRERSHVTQAQHEKSLSTNRSINVENEATSYLPPAAVAGAHKEVFQKEVDVQGVCSGARTDLYAYLGQPKQA